LPKTLVDYIRKIPIDLRTYILPVIYGILGGSAAVAFQKATSVLFAILWEHPSHEMATGTFVVTSLFTILAASIIGGLILTYVSRDAAGSGIPQVKVAFWKDFGFMPMML
jgi:chloride channel protein, CIC family